jgi:hypothetical protein
MKNLIIALALLTSLLAATPSPAQTGDSSPTDPAPSDRIVAARNQYAIPDVASTDSPDSDTLAQFPSRRPGMYPRRGGYPRPAYPSMYRPEINGRHVLIGALIGFGIGAAVVAKGHGSAGATVAIGMIGAGIGAGMGAGMPSYYARNRSRRGLRPDDEDELASRSKPSKPNSPRQAEQDPPAELESARAQATH